MALKADFHSPDVDNCDVSTGSVRARTRSADDDGDRGRRTGQPRAVLENLYYVDPDEMAAAS